MPLPLILGIAAGIAATGGIGAGIHGGVKMKKANTTIKKAQEQHKSNLERYEAQSKKTAKKTDELGKRELVILNGFEEFSNLIERIKNKPDFRELKHEKYEIPIYDKESLKNTSIGAGVLLGGLGGAALGTAGGFAAAGATTSAVMALGTASTGTAIATLHGVAATNATLAALGGGSLAAGGGGMALGATMLGVSSAGVAVLVGGVIFDVVGHKLSKKANKAYEEMEKAQEEINKVCKYLEDLYVAARDYLKILKKVESEYTKRFEIINRIVSQEGRTDWNTFSDEEKITLEDLVLLVSLLYEMCKVNLVIVTNEKELNKINNKDIKETSIKAKNFIAEIDL